MVKVGLKQNSAQFQLLTKDTHEENKAIVGALSSVSGSFLSISSGKDAQEESHFASQGYTSGLSPLPLPLHFSFLITASALQPKTRGALCRFWHPLAILRFFVLASIVAVWRGFPLHFSLSSSQKQRMLQSRSD